MDTHHTNISTPLSAAMKRAIMSLKNDSITLKELLDILGEQSLFVFCTVLTIPFLLPVSIPGISTIFGLAIIFIGTSVMLNRPLWLPDRLLYYRLTSAQLMPVMEKGSKFSSQLESLMRVRLQSLTTGEKISRLNGLTLATGGALLIFPLGFIPFSNTLPALSVLLLALGLLQRDGIFILVSYVVLIITVLYFGALAYFVVAGSQTFLS